MASINAVERQADETKVFARPALALLNLLE
jgi:hypothetical protein